MRAGNRILDLALLIFVVSGAAVVFFRSPGQSSSPAPSASTMVQPSLGGAPPFVLPRLEGPPLQFDGKGPALITLSAVGCVGCQQRVPTDRQAHDLARQHQVPVWNIFVYANSQSAAGFKDKFQPTADQFLYDTDASVSVKAYGGSDASCWILIGPKGEILYRAGSDLAALKPKLEALSPK